VTPPIRRWFKAWSSSLALVAAVTAAAKLLAGHTTLSGLSVLYLLAVLPVAVVWGVQFAIAVSILSTLAYEFFILPPLYSLQLTDLEDGFALVVFLVAAAVVSGLAARSRREARVVDGLAGLQTRCGGSPTASTPRSWPKAVWSRR
jgi:K+-sensing histidine kinase KdpD